MGKGLGQGPQPLPERLDSVARAFNDAGLRYGVADILTEAAERIRELESERRTFRMKFLWVKRWLKGYGRTLDAYAFAALHKTVHEVDTSDLEKKGQEQENA